MSCLVLCCLNTHISWTSIKEGKVQILAGVFILLIFIYFHIYFRASHDTMLRCKKTTSLRKKMAQFQYLILKVKFSAFLRRSKTLGLILILSPKYWAKPCGESDIFFQGAENEVTSPVSPDFRIRTTKQSITVSSFMNVPGVYCQIGISCSSCYEKLKAFWL